MRKTGTIDRLEAVRDYLIVHHKTTYAELMREFGTSRSTAKRDIEQLSLSLPIKTVNGRYGGIFLDPMYNPNKIYLSSKEEIFLQRLLPGLQPEDQETMMSILRKFSK